MSRSDILCALVLLLAVHEFASAQDETVYMAVLNSRRHRIGVADNPLVGLFVSTNKGTTWQHIGWKEYSRNFYAESGSDGVIWSACGNGVLRSTDRGHSWRVTTGWEVTEVLKVKADPADPKHVAAATAYGVVVTTDGGDRWKTGSHGAKRGFASDVEWVRGKAGVLLAATEDGVERSPNGGASWTPSGLRGKGVRIIAGDPRHAGRFWAGTEEDGVFLSTDGGATWRGRSNGLKHMTVYTLAVNPGDSTVVYAGTFGGGVYKTVDEGKTWKQTAHGLMNLDIHALAVIPSDPSTLLAGTLNGGLFLSTDAGASWQFNSQEDAQIWGLSVGTGK